MNEVKLNLSVYTEELVAPEIVAQVVETIISSGLSAWSLVSEGQMPVRADGADLGVAHLASAIGTFQLILAKPSRVLVTVDGGVVNYVADGNVEIEIFDHDNFDDDPHHTRCPPKHFADLAGPVGVPVRGE